MSSKLPASLFGGFTDPSYISTDPDEKKTDPYVKQEAIPSRFLGANFKVGRGRKGFTSDVFLDKKFPTLASAEQNGPKGGDPYASSAPVLFKSRTKEEKAKQINARDFKTASVPKKPTGPGSFVGTFAGKPFEHLQDYKVVARGEAPPRPKPQPANMRTVFPKKGTYGVIGTTFSKIEAPKEGDVYDAIRLAESKAWKEAKTKNISTATFRITGKTKATFDENTVGVSKVFEQYEPKDQKEKKKKEPKEGEKKEALKPFKSAGGPRTGQYGCICPFPNTHDGPDLFREVALKLKREEDKKKGPKPLAGSWKPVSGPKSAVIRSLLRRFY